MGSAGIFRKKPDVTEGGIPAMAEENSRPNETPEGPESTQPAGGTAPNSSAGDPNGPSQAAPVFQMDDFTAQYTEEDIRENKIVALLSYIFILFLVPLLACPNSKFARFHANQGLVLFLTQLAGSIAFGLIRLVFRFIYLSFVGSVLAWSFNALMLVLMVVGIVNAAQGRAQELPIIGKIHILN